MARLTKDQWAEARAWWESDPAVSFQMIATKYGCSRPAVGQKAEGEGWARGGSQTPNDPAPSPKQAPAPKVSTPPKLSPPKAPKVSAKAPAQPEDEAPANVPSVLSQRDRELMLGRPKRGRPTDYRPEFVDELIAHFDIEVESVVDVDVVDKDGKTRIEKKVVANKFPTLTRFAAKIGVTRDTLYEWSTAKDKDGALKYPEFSYAYARAKDSQESLLVEGGMAGVYDPRFAVFAAKNLAGWKDQVETTGEVLHTLATTTELDDAYARGMEAMQAGRAAVMARHKQRKNEAIDVDVNE